MLSETASQSSSGPENRSLANRPGKRTTRKSTPETPRQRKTRSSRACETCREKRTKCSGNAPCSACQRAGLAATCSIRLHARPSRTKDQSSETGPQAVPLTTATHHGVSLQSVARGSFPSPIDSVSANALPLQSPSVSLLAIEGGQSGSHSIDGGPQISVQQSSLLDHPPVFQNTAGVNADSLGPGSQDAQPAQVYRQGSASTALASINPLAQIERSLGDWCASTGMETSVLVFSVGSTLYDIAGSPLPQQPALRVFEDLLFNNLIETEQATPELLLADRDWLVSLYRRHREIPDALNDDQKALVYAILCIARFALIRTDMNTSPRTTAFTFAETTREDITYYHCALRALDRWSRPSLTALYANLYLQTFTVGAGGPSDTKAAQARIAWQIVTLNLQRRHTIDLYPAPERAQATACVTTFLKMDHFRALLTDQQPLIPISQFDLELPSWPSPEQSNPHASSASFTARYLADYANDEVDLSNREYIARTEGQWRNMLRGLLAKGSSRTKEIKWADFRISWIRILLYAPHLSTPDTFPEARSVIARCVSRIFSTYYDLVDLQELNPSWPQLARLVVCGQLLVLICDAGELHERESSQLFAMLLDLLSLHRSSWPACEQLTQGFTGAAQLLDLDLTPNTLYSQQPGPTFSSAMQDQAHQDADEHLEQYLIPINTGPDDENNAAPKPGVNLETLFSDSFEGFSWDGFGTDMAFNTDIPTM